VTRIVTPMATGPGREIVVNVADFAVTAGHGRLYTAGLGSCVAIALHDAKAGVAALAHVLLPSAAMRRGTEAARPAKFADEAVPLLLREMRRLGASGPLTAKLVGGSRMFGSLLSSGVNMGERNIEAARRALVQAGVCIVAEDVGGEFGRNVLVDVATFRVRVSSLERGDRVL
jgi:chemotaxis protein CheD